MSLELVTGPASEPVTVDEIKSHARIDTSADDTYIGTLITTARRWCEQYQGRAYINQTWRLKLDAFPREFVLAYPPLVSVTSITYIDTAEATQTLSTSIYTVDTAASASGLGRVYEADDQFWPATLAIRNAVTLTYVAGYGAAASSVPATVKHAIKMLVAHWYMMREPITVGAAVANVPLSVESLLDMDRVWVRGML